MGHDVTSAIDEALNRTRTLLWPPRTGVWIRLAIIALFLGGVVVNPLRTDTTLAGVPVGMPGPEAITEYANLVVTLAAGLFVAGVIYVVISSLLQFIFVDCLSTNTILLTRTLKLRWGKGIRLVGFYIFLLLIILISMIILTLMILVPGMQTGRFDLARFMILIIETLLALLIVLIPVWIMAILTADFLVPVMIVDDCGILAGWKRMIGLFSGRWMDVGIYTGLKILLIFISGMILGVVIFLISIPLGLLGAVASVGSGLTSMQNPAGIITLGVGTGAMILISLFLLVPLITFFRYYSLVVLRDLDPAYDLLP
nr:hypothetical protein [uncultured Methanospirillum sp.]